MLQQTLFQQALPVLQLIEQHGFDVFFVGGCVRDTLLHKTISDVDIATSAFPNEVKAIFPRTVDVGIEHGTVMVLSGDESYEVTTFRTETTYQDYRRPDAVTFVRSLEEDLKRRDFTINALALDSQGRLYDFHHGVADLEQGIIRCVGVASERFNEDALRMMRAVRFSGQLDFVIEEKTLKGIATHAYLLQKIAVERICVEFEKLMLSKAKQKGMSAFIETALYAYCPYFKDYKDALEKFSRLHLPTYDVAYHWGILLYYFDVDEMTARQMLRAWKLSNETMKTALLVTDILQWRSSRNWSTDDLFFINKETAVIIEDIAHTLHLIDQKEPVDLRHDNLAIHTIKDLALDGKVIMSILGKSSGGKYLGELIENLRVAVLNDKLTNSIEDLTAYILEHFASDLEVEHDEKTTIF